MSSISQHSSSKFKWHNCATRGMNRVKSSIELVSRSSLNSLWVSELHIKRSIAHDRDVLTQQIPNNRHVFLIYDFRTHLGPDKQIAPARRDRD